MVADRTKSCITQELLENDIKQQKPPVSDESDVKVPNKYVGSSGNHSANNTYISTSNRCQKLSNNDVKNESNAGDFVKPTKVANSNKTNSR